MRDELELLTRFVVRLQVRCYYSWNQISDMTWTSVCIQRNDFWNRGAAVTEGAGGSASSSPRVTTRSDTVERRAAEHIQILLIITFTSYPVKKNIQMNRAHILRKM